LTHDARRFHRIAMAQTPNWVYTAHNNIQKKEGAPMTAHCVLIPDDDTGTESQVTQLLRVRGYADVVRDSASELLSHTSDSAAVTLWLKNGLVHESAREADDERTRIQAGIAQLTAREDQVLRQVVLGRLNKQIARDMGISERTVKIHRARVMEKMEAPSLAQLVRLCERVGL
jgi:FixJ family two-component response regulator